MEEEAVRPRRGNANTSNTLQRAPRVLGKSPHLHQGLLRATDTSTVRRCLSVPPTLNLLLLFLLPSLPSLPFSSRSPHNDIPGDHVGLGCLGCLDHLSLCACAWVGIRGIVRTGEGGCEAIHDEGGVVYDGGWERRRRNARSEALRRPRRPGRFIPGMPVCLARPRGNKGGRQRGWGAVVARCLPSSSPPFFLPSPSSSSLKLSPPHTNRRNACPLPPKSIFKPLSSLLCLLERLKMRTKAWVNVCA